MSVLQSKWMREMITRIYSFHCANVIEAANCSPGLRYQSDNMD